MKLLPLRKSMKYKMSINSESGGNSADQLRNYLDNNKKKPGKNEGFYF